VKKVTIQTHGHDKCQRTLGDVLLPRGMNLNRNLVKQGRWFRKYAPGDTVLEGLENEAREAWKGLWADPHPLPPWEWRKRKYSADSVGKSVMNPDEKGASPQGGWLFLWCLASTQRLHGI